MEELIVSKVRIKLLTVFLTSEENLLHVRELVRRTGEEINAVRRELQRMEKFGMVQSEWRANRRLYHFQKNYIFYPQILQMVAKTTGLGGAIIQNKSRLGKIKYAMMATRYFKREPAGAEDVDLLVVGQVDLPALQELVTTEQTGREFEINYSFMDEAEFNFRVRRRDPFILQVITQPKIMLIGLEEELVSGVRV